MARRVFFSFHFERDIFRVNQVRNCNVVAGVDRAGFYDHSEYEEAKRKGDEEIKRLIRDRIRGTSVTVVLIGAQTADRPFVQYEIQQSIVNRNGLLGIHIHHLRTPLSLSDFPGRRPFVPTGVAFPCYDWDGNLQNFAQQIELAGRRADQWRLTI